MNKMNMMNNMNETDGFEVRAYSKSELALMYFPTVQQRCAVRMLMRWIKRVPGLTERMQRCGYSRFDKMFSPQQVRMIVAAVGEP